MAAGRRQGGPRARFLRGVLAGLRLTWPILSGLLLLMAGLGAAVGIIEGWGVFDGVYFAFVTGLTIGYGDLAPGGALGRLLAVAIGLTGIVLTGLVAALGVAALHAALGWPRPGE